MKKIRSMLHNHQQLVNTAEYASVHSLGGEHDVILTTLAMKQI